MQKIIEGIRRFRTEVFNEQKTQFEHLAFKQQAPIALFITCSDSRIGPNLMAQTEPGSLLLLRNAGNIIPPYGTGSGAEGATIEYAVSVLKVPHIIICGHSHCGAMNALLHSEEHCDPPAVSAWFRYAESTRRIVRHKYVDWDDPQLVELAAAENVLVQMDNLRTHPSVAVGLSEGTLSVYGWVYRIETGEILGFDPELRRFVSVTESCARPMSSAAPLLSTHNIQP